MNQFIVPVDFSETSKNAARYAAGLASQVSNAHLTLYYVFDKIEAGSDGTPLEDDDKARKEVMELALQSVRNELTGITDVPISVVAEEDDHFVDSLESYVRRNGIHLIIMGIAGASRLGQIIMGSNTLDVVKRGTTPVIIVPPEAKFTGARNIMFATDFKEVDKTIPIAPIKELLNLFHPSLHIVNIDDEHYVQPTAEYETQRNKLQEMMKEFKPEYYFIRMFDFMEAINQFVKDHDIDMILTVPKDHSLFSNLFKTSHTKKLAYYSHVPILSIHA
jgi:nucleotide-binding universal stress UspA family protein